MMHSLSVNFNERMTFCKAGHWIHSHGHSQRAMSVLPSVFSLLTKLN